VGEAAARASAGAARSKGPANSRFDTHPFPSFFIRYFGNLDGDPRGGRTRCLTNNVFNAGFGGTMAFFCGTQEPGQPLVVDDANPFSRGMVDWGFAIPNPAPPAGAKGVAALNASGTGAYKMARTLSPSSPNQVLDPGRKIMMAWLDLAGIGQSGSLPRDISLDAVTGELLQQFSPELQALRLGSGDPAGLRAQQLEVVATFTVAASAPSDASFGVRVLASDDGGDYQVVGVLLATQLVTAGGRAGPLQPAIATGAAGAVRVHIIVDHSILTAIFNNRTAVTAGVSPKGAASAGVELFGVDGTLVSCVWQAWALRDANNTFVPRR
jgi:hypothetical protein